MKLLVGLGNPGEEHHRNRHNAGFVAVDEIAEAHGLGPWRRRFQGLTAEGHIGGGKCLLLKPMTFMNESGRAVSAALRFFKLSPGDVIVFHDEIDLAPGKIKVKTGGGHAGHNGLKSISAHIGNDYRRVRLGIGHPGNKAQVTHYVLRDFAKADQQWLEPLLIALARAAPRLVDGSEAAFLNEFARLSRPDPRAVTALKAAQKTAQEKAAAPFAPSVREIPLGQPAGRTLVKPGNSTTLGAKLKSWLQQRIRGASS